MKGNRTVHGAAEDNSAHPQMHEFRVALREAGYIPPVIHAYVQGAKRYLEKGFALDRETAYMWFEKCKQEGHEVTGNRKTGVYTFIKFINGEPLVRKKRKPKEKKTVDYYSVCDEDCFNCKYKDCIKPDYLCKSIPYEQWVGRDTFEYDIP